MPRVQARLHGRFAAHCMVGSADELAVGFNFELFTHTARFFGFKVLEHVVHNYEFPASCQIQGIFVYVVQHAYDFYALDALIWFASIKFPCCANALICRAS